MVQLLSRYVSLALVTTAQLGCGIRTPATQCRLELDREVACQQVDPGRAEAMYDTCIAALSHASPACQHAYNRFVGCLDTYSCEAINTERACDDVYGDAMAACPQAFADVDADADVDAPIVRDGRPSVAASGLRAPARPTFSRH